MTYYYPIYKNVIEVHYWLNDETHIMDAFVQNECERHFLNITKELSKVFDVEVTVVTRPLDEGGLKRWFQISLKNEGKHAVVTTAIITSLITALIATPVTTAVESITKEVIEKAFKDYEKEAQENEKVKLEIESLKLDIELKKQQLNNNKAVDETKARFYKSAARASNVYKVSFVQKNNIGETIRPENFIEREDFQDYFMQNLERYDERVEGALIEILKPDFSEGTGIWYGIYEGKNINFKMRAADFKRAIQSGKVEFKKGTTIVCNLIIHKVIKSDKKEYTLGFSVEDVTKFKNHESKSEIDNKIG